MYLQYVIENRSFLYLVAINNKYMRVYICKYHPRQAERKMSLRCLEGYVVGTKTVVPLTGKSTISIPYLIAQQILSEKIESVFGVTVREEGYPSKHVTVADDRVSFSNAEGDDVIVGSPTTGLNITSVKDVTITAHESSQLSISGRTVVVDTDAQITGNCDIYGNAVLLGNVPLLELSIPVVWGGCVASGTAAGFCNISKIGSIVYLSFTFPRNVRFTVENYLTLPVGTIPEGFRPSETYADLYLFYMTPEFATVVMVASGRLHTDGSVVIGRGQSVTTLSVFRATNYITYLFDNVCMYVV